MQYAMRTEVDIDRRKMNIFALSFGCSRGGFEWIDLVDAE
jgi:hypothetical protein